MVLQIGSFLLRTTRRSPGNPFPDASGVDEAARLRIADALPGVLKAMRTADSLH